VVAGVLISIFSSAIVVSLACLSDRARPLGLLRLKVGGGSFSWSNLDGKGGSEGTLKAGAIFFSDGLSWRGAGAGAGLVFA